MCPEHGGNCKCANWHYEKFDGKGRASKVLSRCTALLADIKDDKIDREASSLDTRPVHYRLFNGLTKSGCEAVTGNYRGSKSCLENYGVVITNGKSRVETTPATEVSASMTALAGEIAKDFDALAGIGGAVGLKTMSDVVGWLDIAMERMISFLGIHPYADGNGHIGRIMMFCYLSAAGIWPNNWPLDDRPPHPYDEAIAAFRNGYVDGLRDVMLQYISWKPTIAAPPGA